jgi:hypothetical protein
MSQSSSREAFLRLTVQAIWRILTSPETNAWVWTGAAVLLLGFILLRLIRHPWFVTYPRVDAWTDWLTRDFRQPIPHRLLVAARSQRLARQEAAGLLAQQLTGYQQALEAAKRDWRLGAHRERVLAALEAHVADLNRMQREIQERDL